MHPLKLVSSSNSWSDLNKKLEELTKSGQAKFAGSTFELLVKYYLLTNPRYQSKLKNVWLLNEVKEGIKKKLNLPDQDEGIDIIAETKEGHFWAIQAKYRSDPNETLTLGGKGSLATFSNLAFGYCKNITHGLVCTTVNKPPKKIKLIKQVGFETLESFLSLDDNDCEEWKFLVARSVGKIIKPHNLEPRPHQIEAIKKTVEYFKSNDRGKVIMPCGTGKSLAAFWIANEMKAKNILIAVPSLALLQQTLKVWTREFLINDIQPDWLCVCSDDTVKEDQDSFVSYTYDLGIEVTTNKDEIIKFLKTKSENIKVIFTTYQSGRVTAQGSKGFTYDLGIMDEAHKTVGHQDKPMAHLLHQKNIRIKHRLFMTATERLFRANKEEYLSMDDEGDYGKIIYELTFKDAINANPPIISDYKIITFGISEPEIEEIYQDNKFLQVKKELKDITAREFATAIALRKAIKDLKITNAISFHSSIKRAVNFKEQQSLITKIYPEYGSLKTFHVSGDMATSDRSSQMRLFGEGKGLMTNARCLTEGVDLPAIDCVCFTDPKRSKVDIVQAAGRALRLSSGKKFGYILIPIFIPADQDPETASKDNAFEEVVATVGALSTQDTRIAEYLRVIAEGKKPTGGSPVEGTIAINVLTKIDPEKFNKAIQLKIWDKIAKLNYRSYEEAKSYVRSLKLKGVLDFRKHCNVLKTIPKDIPSKPDSVYKNEFESFSSFLGTNRKKYIFNKKKGKKFISYVDACNHAKSKNFKRILDWKTYTKTKEFPNNIPVYPDRFYKNEFISYQHFLNLPVIFKKEKPIKIKKEKPIKIKKEKPIKIKKNRWMNFNEACLFVQSLGLNNVAKFNEYCRSEKRAKDLPTNPNSVYKNLWKGWVHFLNIKEKPIKIKKERKFKSYQEAKIYAESLKFNDPNQWWQHTKREDFPIDIPKFPYAIYKKDWKSMNIFLGIEKENVKKLKENWLSYEASKEYASSQNLERMKDWFWHTKTRNFPEDIPNNPHIVYKDKFEGWRIFLGKKSSSKKN